MSGDGKRGFAAWLKLPRSSAMHPARNFPVAWRGKGLVRVSLLLAAAAVIAALAAGFGIARDLRLPARSDFDGVSWGPVLRDCHASV